MLDKRNSWRHDPRLWLELFVLVNLAFLAPDIYLAHSVNEFRRSVEYVPLYFSMVAPVIILIAVLSGYVLNWHSVWRDLGHIVGWMAVAIGFAGVIYHLDSSFFHERTIKSLVYAAPFAAPLAYTGLGLLLIMNRMMPEGSTEWAYWVLLMALGGFVGNFIFSLTDHAQNGFYHWTEWIPVVTSAFAVGFLVAPFLTPVGRRFYELVMIVLLVQAATGLLGFWFHTVANLHGTSTRWLDNFIHGAPAFAPLLFPNLALLALLSVWQLRSMPTALEPQ